MSKPFYFTGRRDFSRSAISIRLIEQQGSLTKFDARIDLSHQKLPGDAILVLEAHHTTYLERFDLGRVGDFEGRTSRVLKDLEPGDRPTFRLKIVSADAATKGRQLASIDHVRPSVEGDEGSGASLLVIIPRSRHEMKDEFWRVKFEEGAEREPQLWINKDVPGLFQSLQNQDPWITAIIMPEVLRQVLNGLIDADTSWTEEGILGRWLEFALALHGERFESGIEDPEEDVKQKRSWVDEVVSRFAVLHRFFDRYQEQAGANAVESEA